MFAARFDPTFGDRKRKISEVESESESEGGHEELEVEIEEEIKEEIKKEIKEEIKKDTQDEITEETQDEKMTDASTTDSTSSDDSVPEEENKGHSSVLDRFNRTMRLQDKIVEADLSKIEEPAVETKDVGPIPQPKLPRDKKLRSREAINRNLNWLTTPEYHNTESTKRFSDLSPKLDERLVSNLKTEFGIEDAFSVQVSVIENVLNAANRNRLNPKPFGDYLINAATGSGKTLAYLIPIVQTLEKRTVPKLRCIILAPTKPLVSQVYSNLLNLIKGFNLNVMMLKNDQSLASEHERYVQNKPDILVSAPGRLVDHLINYNIDLSQLRFLVVDEADRLLNQSFQNWCDLLVSKIEKDQKLDGGADFYNSFSIRCVKMILSATLTTNSERLSHLKLFKPDLVVINDSEELVNELYQLPPNLDEYYIRVPEALSFYKPLILLHLFMSQDDLKTHGLVFTKSNESAIRLSRLMELLVSRKVVGSSDQVNILSVNSSIRTQERQKVFKKFDKEGGILISTDLVSRGLNFDSIKFVMNYDLPLSTKEYIHRVGRTARANKPGKALTFCFGEGEYRWFKKLVYSGGVINRHQKTVNEIKFVRKEDMTGEGIEFAVDLDDKQKKDYEETLKKLESEVFQRH
ncbi:hypothetical protein FOA43_004180 [Brettanomyces nanus]|uniref:ATP-dependent RNA helicase n=1 Tax=Eeniella nana TaxID=13502 RepID=A0A875S628_EENNA|nr:uncharacterized protein FOA43_004180 [Brettanomyces nanus]QPG76786.1 hypothetical protein FOA43_004180 [Brettanomyces nanus]